MILLDKIQKPASFWMLPVFITTLLTGHLFYRSTLWWPNSFPFSWITKGESSAYNEERTLVFQPHACLIDSVKPKGFTVSLMIMRWWHYHQGDDTTISNVFEDDNGGADDGDDDDADELCTALWKRRWEWHQSTTLDHLASNTTTATS